MDTTPLSVPTSDDLRKAFTSRRVRELHELLERRPDLREISPWAHLADELLWSA